MLTRINDESRPWCLPGSVGASRVRGLVAVKVTNQFQLQTS